jgi:hypothetical protein
MDLSDEKDVKGLGGIGPTVSAGYIQNLVMHPTAERDPDRVGPHYAPCPHMTASDIAKDQAINEWVLNHLPLTEEQKQNLMRSLTLDKRRKEMLDESLTIRSQNIRSLHEKEKQRLAAEDEKKKDHRRGIKERPTGRKRGCGVCECS